MTPAQENAVRNQGRECVKEIRQALNARPKPAWNSVTPPILRKHHEKVKALGVSLEKFISIIGRMNGRYGAQK
ncbi:hypothetical protein CGX53_20565 [Salmonella enterica]|uniref:hypothetical protein n=1 Tax=Salmonella enterica TaxID=28901 RepID=UPI0009AC08B6|nr:hypothetical protein [Salmonella enterica]EAA1041225.1 hypothetical protein [Salmonella enterica subsp. enterica serovar Westeinde]EBA0744766.1 hypothetical protein [Salmonella enterica subsp. enterica]EBC9934430.1 hypothetical protein [Salmonella enterica subsp. enterica serovar Nigeria]EBF8123369.1 hypothetical protein [Salmonella enterica subsp. enterica serovar Aba]EBG0542737.1 hypothetical protein [Salmonella enterica subsp. enterica serovar Ank]EBH8772581.1 hypothetical protein [Salm